MKQILLIIFVCSSLAFIAQAQTVKVFHENKGQGVTLYASNPGVYPSSLSIEFELTGMTFSEGDKKIFVVPAKAEKFRIGEVTASGKGRFGFKYTYRSAMGDVTQQDYDKNYRYDLPFQKGGSYHLVQGYNGKFSHQGENSLDFTMPEGTEVVAARDGIVAEVVQNNTQACPREECKKFNNYITIMHPDGTFARYGHIKYNGAKFKIGDHVNKGDVIAYSGNTGWSSGPHLHFVCFLGGFDKWQTLETQFRIDKGDKAMVLQEGNTYARDY